jgi:hypothetical protein
MYVTTEDEGLWYSSNRRAPSPTFTPCAGYPFYFPSRVFFNPYDTNEVWVTSFGNGMRLGRVVEPRPVLGLKRTNSISTLSVSAALGQHVVVSASSDLKNWTPLATNVMYTNQIVVGETFGASPRFFRAAVP